jgi:large subunit ribosomal protein L5
MITGQKPVVSKSKVAISNFKLRVGMPVGLSVTLRKQKMYDFMDRLINIVLPRVRDFQGTSLKSFDQNGNYNLGLKDCSVFPELNIEDIAKIHGLQITITTTSKNPEHVKTLLTEMGFPFKKITN